MSTDSGYDTRTAPPRGQDAGSLARDLGDAAKDKARAAWHDAKETAHDKLDEQKQSAASGLGSLAHAMHAAAGQLERERHDDIARLAHSAAGGIERVASTLQGRDLDRLVRDTEDFARRQPMTFFAGAVAAGFLAVRFLKSSDRARDRDERRGGDRAFRHDERPARADEPPSDVNAAVTPPPATPIPPL